MLILYVIAEHFLQGEKEARTDIVRLYRERLARCTCCSTHFEKFKSAWQCCGKIKEVLHFLGLASAANRCSDCVPSFQELLAYLGRDVPGAAWHRKKSGQDCVGFSCVHRVVHKGRHTVDVCCLKCRNMKSAVAYKRARL